MKTLNPILVEHAKNWAAANKSDPFAFATALSEIRHGISTHATPDGKPGHHQAEADLETREYTMNGRSVEYKAVVYKNLARP